MLEHNVTTFTSLQMIPEKLRSAWNGRQVYLSASEDEIIIKKMEAPDLWELRERLKNSSSEITDKDIEEAVLCARTKSYDQNRS